MDKETLVRAACARLGLPRREVERNLEALLGVIQAGLASDGEVVLRGFGTFRRGQTAMRLIPNAKTGKKRWSKPQPTVRFSPGTRLQGAIRGSVGE